MRKIGPNGTSTYEGFCYDLLEAIAQSLGFRFVVYDKEKYGAEEDGKWIGAIGEVVDKVSLNNTNRKSNNVSVR